MNKTINKLYNHNRSWHWALCHGTGYQWHGLNVGHVTGNENFEKK